MDELFAFFKWMFGGVGKIIGIILLIACTLLALDYLVAIATFLLLISFLLLICDPKFDRDGGDELLSEEELRKKRNRNLWTLGFGSWFGMLIFEIEIVSILRDRYNVDIIPQSYSDDVNTFLWLSILIAIAFNSLVLFSCFMIRRQR